jgi:hypothetical protein
MGAVSRVVPATGKPASHDGRKEDKNPFEETLKEAEALIQYAASAAIDIGDDVRRAVLAARRKGPEAWSDEDVNVLLGAQTKLSSQLRPVTGESARKCLMEDVAKKRVRTFEVVALLVAVLIVLPGSFGLSVATAECAEIRSDIESANALVVTLHGQLPLTEQPPTRPNEEETANLQRFAATVRDIKSRANSLARFDLLAAGTRHEALKAAKPDQLPVPIEDFTGTTKEWIHGYQHVRTIAQQVQEDVSTGSGAVATCFLPMFYALLGACAYLARRYEREIEARTFTGTENPAVRLLIAGIAGLVVGLFAKVGGSESGALPPLAVAFLVGYGADVFFVFLDGMLQMLWRPRSDATSSARQPGSAGTASSP